jgi:hypothetical protein
MKKYTAVGDMLLMRPTIKLQIDESSGLRKEGNILIPDGAKLTAGADNNPIMEFVVISAGPDCKVAKDGDTVLANGGIAMKIPITKDLSIAMIAERQIVAVVTELPDEVAKTD